LPIEIFLLREQPVIKTPVFSNRVILSQLP
jgi:hypothetical protein